MSTTQPSRPIPLALTMLVALFSALVALAVTVELPVQVLRGTS